MKIHQTLLLAAMMILLTSCSLFQPESKSPTPGPTADLDCEWTPVRGVAELTGKKPDSDSARFRFYPGDVEFSASLADKQAQEGDEYKVVLAIPDQIECGEPRVREMQPLEPTN